MKAIFLLGLLVGLVLADSPVDKFVQEENVLVLKSDNFEDALKLDFVLVEFCKLLAFWRLQMYLRTMSHN